MQWGTAVEGITSFNRSDCYRLIAPLRNSEVELDNTARARAYVSLRQTINDLTVVAGDDTNPSGFTLLAILRNEMYFLPDFLAHYRSLGVERVVFLNDRSIDGSLEYLAQQKDTIVVESVRTYGEKLQIPAHLSSLIDNPRILYFWRGMLHDMFASGRWALQVDLDEFIWLPHGITFQDLVRRLEGEGKRSVWGVMLDVYPETIEQLRAQEKDARIDLTATWYFDGERHLKLRGNRTPKVIHPGARARLYHQYGIDELHTAIGRKQQSMINSSMRKIGLIRKPAKYNAISKPIMLKWEQNAYFSSSHKSNLPTSPEYLIPIQHFRFVGDIFRRMETGLRERSYYNNSADHRLLKELLRAMTVRNGSFLYRNSLQLRRFADFSNSGNTVGL